MVFYGRQWSRKVSTGGFSNAMAQLASVAAAQHAAVTAHRGARYHRYDLLNVGQNQLVMDARSPRAATERTTSLICCATTKALR